MMLRVVTSDSPSNFPSAKIFFYVISHGRAGNRKQEGFATLQKGDIVTLRILLK